MSEKILPFPVRKTHSTDREPPDGAPQGGYRPAERKAQYYAGQIFNAWAGNDRRRMAVLRAQYGLRAEVLERILQEQAALLWLAERKRAA